MTISYEMNFVVKIRGIVSSILNGDVKSLAKAETKSTKSEDSIIM